MVYISVKKGLDIPIQGKPQGAVQLVPPSQVVGVDLKPYFDQKLRLLVKEGDQVRLGQPLIEDKNDLKRKVVSPATGIISSIVRGEKRRLEALVIERMNEDTPRSSSIEVKTKDDVMEALSNSGLYFHIKVRPFGRYAKSTDIPRSIFVKAIETAPFAVPPELQTIGNEEYLQIGLSALNLVCPENVHLVYSASSNLQAFLSAKDVQKSTVSGPHPAGNPSIHISHIDPIRSQTDVVWTCSVWDVIALGHFIKLGVPYTQRVISFGGEGFNHAARTYVRTNIGYPVQDLIQGQTSTGPIRIIVGDPLTGRIANGQEFIGFEDFIISAIPELGNERLMLHFLRLGAERYTASGTYLSGHFPSSSRTYYFDTNQHGEERAFIDGSIYERVMPLRVLPMQIVKACMADDYERAVEYGFLEVVPEDFALCEFICPSKVEMVGIIDKALRLYAKEVLV